MIDWSKLGAIPTGLAVEGPTDKVVIEAFLEAGERAGQWTGWRSKLLIQEANGLEGVLSELDASANAGLVWGLIDQDWRSSKTQAALQVKYGASLLILPRIHIDNYFTDPNELERMFPQAQRTQFTAIRANIASKRDDWIKQGAISKALFESGAEEFCSKGGYKLLRQVPVPSDENIIAHLQTIQTVIEPNTVFGLYQNYLQSFQTNSTIYHHCVSGKLFLKQVVVPELNRHFRSRKYEAWITDLTSTIPDCPRDIAPILMSLVNRI